MTDSSARTDKQREDASGQRWAQQRRRREPPKGATAAQRDPENTRNEARPRPEMKPEVSEGPSGQLPQASQPRSARPGKHGGPAGRCADRRVQQSGFRPDDSVWQSTTRKEQRSRTAAATSSGGGGYRDRPGCGPDAGRPPGPRAAPQPPGMVKPVRATGHT